MQFRNSALVRDVRCALADAGLPASRLELEVTESLLLGQGQNVLELLYELRALGIRIAMDDFGTGYSSLSYLRRFPFDKIKIDQSFVRGMGDQEDCAAIVRAVVGLGRSLGMSVNAEGVETEAQLAALRAEGCGELQGYLFSEPKLGFWNSRLCCAAPASRRHLARGVTAVLGCGEPGIGALFCTPRL